jgi:hypothetical protein
MGERLGGSGRGGWEMRHVLLACKMGWMVRTIRYARMRT